MTCNIFLVCYIGEVLSEKCKKIGDMVYMTNWYHLPDKNILSMIMIISRSSVEVKMTAGKIIDMSVFTFASTMLMKLTISNHIFIYLTIMLEHTFVESYVFCSEVVVDSFESVLIHSLTEVNSSSK
ncbi:hypothetical protein E2986_11725 [Frieseomelitta varia]|uniref:Uncharacterized protein n=1 Tax=Frieseomelitta varia TaxID=561572 RepID=A0A833VMN6_9HYME|nr:hypothetical protein E2986_11725 [Frieseomelitta varia]